MQDIDELRNAGMMSAIKQEFHDAVNDEGMLYQDIRQLADHQGDFLRDINSPFGVTSPIQPRVDEMRTAA